jgi:hypothetical protein
MKSPMHLWWAAEFRIGERDDDAHVMERILESPEHLLIFRT